MTKVDLKRALEQMLNGEMSTDDIVDVLISLENEGVGSDELAVGVDVMRANMNRIDVPERAIDIVGTGGTGLKTLSISTATAIVVAAAGTPVAKHGNRGASSPTGTADVLSKLGVNIAMSPERAAQAVSDVGMGFLFAPTYHPAMRHVGPARKQIKGRTLFNRLGPLCNPGEVKYMLVGCAERHLVKPMADALSSYVKRAIVVRGHDGLDEITTTGPSDICEVSPEGSTLKTMTLSDWAAPPAQAKDLVGGAPDYNAKRLKQLLEGQKDAYRDIVLLNAREALWIAGQDKQFTSKSDAAMAAQESIDSGKAKTLLKNLAEFSHG